MIILVTREVVVFGIGYIVSFSIIMMTVIVPSSATVRITIVIAIIIFIIMTPIVVVVRFVSTTAMTPTLGVIVIASS